MKKGNILFLSLSIAGLVMSTQSFAQDKKEEAEKNCSTRKGRSSLERTFGFS